MNRGSPHPRLNDARFIYVSQSRATRRQLGSPFNGAAPHKIPGATLQLHRALGVRNQQYAITEVTPLAL
jgi:hypothetical protein